MSTLLNFFVNDARDHPWNLFPNFPENLSSTLVQSIIADWNLIPETSQLGLLVGTLVPHKRKISQEYKDNVVALVDFAFLSSDSSSLVKQLAKVVKSWIQTGYLDLEEFKNSSETMKVLEEGLGLLGTSFIRH